MKRKFLTGIAAAALTIVMSSFALVSYKANKMMEEFWKQLGLTEEQAKQSIITSFTNNGMSSWGKAKAIATGNRAAIVTDAGNYAKQYINSPAFQNEYRKWRDGQLKSFNLVPPVTREQIVKKRITEAEGVIKTYENLLKTTTDPNAKKDFKMALEYSTKQLAEFKSGKSAQIDYEVKQEEKRYKEQKDAQDALTKKVPESHLEFVKARLKEFLEITEGIDYNAKLIQRNDKKYFANLAYESKNAKWKMAFRAGKEVTETARTFVQQWLKELK
jgi:hypothetical protein